MQGHGELHTVLSLPTLCSPSHDAPACLSAHFIIPTNATTPCDCPTCLVTHACSTGETEPILPVALCAHRAAICPTLQQRRQPARPLRRDLPSRCSRSPSTDRWRTRGARSRSGARTLCKPRSAQPRLRRWWRRLASAAGRRSAVSAAGLGQRSGRPSVRERERVKEPPICERECVKKHTEKNTHATLMYITSWLAPPSLILERALLHWHRHVHTSVL